MTSDVPPFFRALADLLHRVEVTDAAGAPLGFTGGFTAAVDLIRSRTAAGSKVIFIGNGGSAAIASHQAVDYWKNGGMRAIAFNDTSLLTCVGNDYGWPHVFEKPVEMFADAGDVLIAISSSGRSDNILRGARAAARRQCRIVTLSGFEPDNPLRRLGELNFYVPAGSYGPVEITHLSVCHSILDRLIELTPTPASSLGAAAPR